MNWRPKLSFAFTVQRRLNVCVSQLQNEGRLHRTRRVYITAINETLSQFFLEGRGRWVISKAIGELQYLDESSTLVSGEIQQVLWQTDWIFFFVVFILVTCQSAVFVGPTGTGLTIVCFSLVLVLLLRKRQNSMVRLLTELKQLLDPNIVQPM